MSSRHRSDAADAPRVFLGLGSNLGQRRAQVAEAVRRLKEAGVLHRRISSLYETQPLEVTDQPDFINLVCEVRTSFGAEELLQSCLLVERDMGRLRFEPKGPRTIDIDILYYGQQVHLSNRLSIPHPAIPQRKFVLVPMVEIAPEFRDPVSHLSMEALLERCPDRSSVKRLPKRPEI